MATSLPVAPLKIPSHLRDCDLAVLFLHGLGLPCQVQHLNQQFRQHFARHYSSHVFGGLAAPGGNLMHFAPQYRVETVDYASLLHSRQLALHRAVGGEQWRWSPVEWMRTLPFRYLQLGMRFWGDGEHRRLVFQLVADALNRLAASDHPGNGGAVPRYLVIAGFSMGATIAIEFLNEYARERRSLVRGRGSVPRGSNSRVPSISVGDMLTEEGRRLLECGLLQMVTLGCAINWHHPLRPFTRSMNFSVPWLNIHYGSDVLASALRHQGQETMHILDVELTPAMSLQTLLRSLTSASHGDPIGTRLERCAQRIFQMVIRFVPLCHTYYFVDPDVYNLILSQVMQSWNLKQSRRDERTEHSPLPIWTTPPPSSADLGNNGVATFEYPKAVDELLLRRMVFPRTTRTTTLGRRKHFVFLYLHGMSNTKTIQREESLVDQCLAATVSQLLHRGHSGFSYSLHSIRYHHLIEKDQELRLRAHVESTKNGGWGWWQSVKDIVLTRLPVALSYWSETEIRREVNRGVRHVLSALRDQYSSDTKEEDVYFVMMGYTVGSLVAALVLGEIQQEFGSLLPSSEDVSDSQMRMYALFTLGCPLPWFGNVGDFRLPTWSKEKSADGGGGGGWYNFYYHRDVHSVPLRVCDPSLEKTVTRDISLPTARPMKLDLYPQQQQLKTKDSLFQRIQDGFRHQVSRWVPAVAQELLASVNGCYLYDQQVWCEVEAMMERVIRNRE